MSKPISISIAISRPHPTQEPSIGAPQSRMGRSISFLSDERDGDTYTDLVFSRGIDLIATGIWTGIDNTQYQAWLNNFRTVAERYFAACVLDALIYRSGAQAVALMEHLFQRTLPEKLGAKVQRQDLADWKEQLQGEADPGIRIVPVLRRDHPPTKSGPYLARIYRRELKLKDRWMIWPWQIEKERRRGVTAFLFIDDFLGTGTQFNDFAREFSLAKALGSADAVYAPLAAHTTGTDFLSRQATFLHVTPVESLDGSYDVFGSSSPWFRDDFNSPASAAAFYGGLAKRRFKSLNRRFWRGFGELGLAYAFEHAVPNNTLALFWYRGDDWVPLFTR